MDLKNRLGWFCHPVRLWCVFGNGERRKKIAQFYEVHVWKPLFQKKKKEERKEVMPK